MHIREKLHLHDLLTLTLTGITSSTIHVKGKMLWLKPPHLAQRLLRKQVAYLIIRLYISNRVAARGFANRVLVDHLDLADAVNITRNRLMKSNFIAKLSFYLPQCRVKYLFYQRGLAAATN